jgi:hypothetical protein
MAVRHAQMQMVKNGHEQPAPSRMASPGHRALAPPSRTASGRAGGRRRRGPRLSRPRGPIRVAGETDREASVSGGAPANVRRGQASGSGGRIIICVHVTGRSTRACEVPIPASPRSPIVAAGRDTFSSSRQPRLGPRGVRVHPTCRPCHGQPFFSFAKNWRPGALFGPVTFAL